MWMDGLKREYEVTSARVWEGVLVLQDAKQTGHSTAIKRVRFPVANIREWTDDE